MKDGETYSLSALFGRSFSRGRFVGGAQYTQREPIWQDERRFSECGLLDFGGTPFCDDSIFRTPPLFNPETDGGGGLLLVVDSDTGEVRDHSLAAPTPTTSRRQLR